MMTQVHAALLVTCLLLILPLVWRTIVNYRKLSSLPTAGSSGFFSTFITRVRSLKHAQEIVQDGYDKYRGSAFKVPLLARWIIAVSGPQQIEELRRAPEEVLSLRRALAENLNLDVTIGHRSDSDPYHINVIRTTLTRNIPTKFAEIQDEISTAFNEYIPAKDEWIKIKAYSTIMDIVCRASNRLLVGLPLCREADFIELNNSFTLDVLKATQFINLFPLFLRPFAGRLCTKVASDLQRGIKHLEPLIRERIELYEQHGKEWAGKPNDIVSWLLDAKPNQSIRDIVIRILIINFAAIHTTSMSFTDVLYDLATRPEYVEPMRKEVDAVIQSEGWSKASVGKLRKLDSFVRESLRLSDRGPLVMGRKVMKDFTFSDGTMIPAGNTIAVPFAAIHKDEEYYPDAATFDGFRFERMSNQEGENTKYQIDTIDANHLSFGGGRHACPGRFFAASELKTMLAYVLMNYDVKMANDGQRPPSFRFGAASVPNPTAEVMFRRRNIDH